MDKNTSEKKLNINAWILFHMAVVEDVMPGKDSFLIFPLTDCKRECLELCCYFSSFTSHCDSCNPLRNFCSFLVITELPMSSLLLSASHRLIERFSEIRSTSSTAFGSISPYFSLWTFLVFKKIFLHSPGPLYILFPVGCFPAP